MDRMDNTIRIGMQKNTRASAVLAISVGHDFFFTSKLWTPLAECEQRFKTKLLSHLNACAKVCMALFHKVLHICIELRMFLYSS